MTASMRTSDRKAEVSIFSFCHKISIEAKICFLNQQFRFVRLEVKLCSLEIVTAKPKTSNYPRCPSLKFLDVYQLANSIKIEQLFLALECFYEANDVGVMKLKYDLYLILNVLLSLFETLCWFLFVTSLWNDLHCKLAAGNEIVNYSNGALSSIADELVAAFPGAPWTFTNISSCCRC